MATVDQVNSLALKVFLDSNPWLQAALSASSGEEAKILGIGIEEYRGLRIEESLSKDSEDRGLHPWDYKLLIAEANGLDVTALREQGRLAEANAMGINTLL